MSDANQAQSEYSIAEYVSDVSDVSDVRDILNQESDPSVFTASIKPLTLRLPASKAMEDPAWGVRLFLVARSWNTAA